MHIITMLFPAVRPAATMAMTTWLANESKHSGVHECFDPFVDLPADQARSTFAKARLFFFLNLVQCPRLGGPGLANFDANRPAVEMTNPTLCAIKRRRADYREGGGGTIPVTTACLSRRPSLARVKPSTSELTWPLKK